MRRRQQGTETLAERPLPPAWTNNFAAGMAYASDLAGSNAMSVWLPVLRRAREDWCRANGCHQLGPPCPSGRRECG